MIHDLKILPVYYKAVAKGLKTFEFRKNDRNFKQGDFVVLREWGNSIYRGNILRRPFPMPYGYTDSKPLIFKIGFVLQSGHNDVVFSILPLGANDEVI